MEQDYPEYYPTLPEYYQPTYYNETKYYREYADIIQLLEQIYPEKVIRALESAELFTPLFVSAPNNQLCNNIKNNITNIIPGTTDTYDVPKTTYILKTFESHKTQIILYDIKKFKRPGKNFYEIWENVFMKYEQECAEAMKKSYSQIKLNCREGLFAISNIPVEVIMKFNNIKDIYIIPDVLMIPLFALPCKLWTNDWERYLKYNNINEDHENVRSPYHFDVGNDVLDVYFMGTKTSYPLNNVYLCLDSFFTEVGIYALLNTSNIWNDGKRFIADAYSYHVCISNDTGELPTVLKMLFREKFSITFMDYLGYIKTKHNVLYLLQKVLFEILKGVAYLNVHKVVHSDLEVGNIVMVQESNGVYIPKIIGFEKAIKYPSSVSNFLLGNADIFFAVYDVVPKFFSSSFDSLSILMYTYNAIKGELRSQVKERDVYDQDIITQFANQLLLPAVAGAGVNNIEQLDIREEGAKQYFYQYNAYPLLDTTIKCEESANPFRLLNNSEFFTQLFNEV